MAFTLTQYQAINDAIAMGQLVVQYDGKKVEYRSLSDLQLVVQYDGKKVEYRSLSDLRQARQLIRDELIATGQLTDTTADGVQRGGTTYAAYCPD